jgi:hypothetical protein
MLAVERPRGMVYLWEMSLIIFHSSSEGQSGDFQITTREEAIKFEEYLHAFHDNHLECPGKIIFGLGNIFDVCHRFKREYGGRVFTAILDLAISQTNCTCELDDCIKAWNQYFSADNKYGNKLHCSGLDGEKSFEGKFYYHRYLNSFVLKYRAHWDKIMGLHFLVFNYGLYQKFIRAHKKKAMFLAEFEGHPLVDPEVVNYVKNELALFDLNYRTHEAHGTGRLRKFTFGSGMEQTDNPVYDIINDKYFKYTILAPKIFECVQYFLAIPEALELAEKRKQS